YELNHYTMSSNQLIEIYFSQKSVHFLPSQYDCIEYTDQYLSQFECIRKCLMFSLQNNIGCVVMLESLSFNDYKVYPKIGPTIKEIIDNEFVLCNYSIFNIFDERKENLNLQKYTSECGNKCKPNCHVNFYEYESKERKIKHESSDFNI